MTVSEQRQSPPLPHLKEPWKDCLWSSYKINVALPTGTPTQPLPTLEELLEYRNDQQLTMGVLQLDLVKTPPLSTSCVILLTSQSEFK